jgi:hypothetical protein
MRNEAKERSQLYSLKNKEKTTMHTVRYSSFNNIIQFSTLYVLETIHKSLKSAWSLGLIDGKKLTISILSLISVGILSQEALNLIR